MSTRALLVLVTLPILWTGRLAPRARELPGGVDLALGAHLALLLAWLLVVARSSGVGAGGLPGPWRARWLPIGAGAAVALFVLSGAGYAVAGGMLNLEPPAGRGLVPRDFGARWLLLLGISLSAALLEEWVFRGVLLERLGGLGPWSAVLGSAAVFAAYHLSLFQLLPTFILGAGLAVLVLRLDALWPAVVAHAGFNALGLVAVLAGGGAGSGGS